MPASGKLRSIKLQGSRRGGQPVSNILEGFHVKFNENRDMSEIIYKIVSYKTWGNLDAGCWETSQMQGGSMVYP